MPTTDLLPDAPPHPDANTTNWKKFGVVLRALRKWADLTVITMPTKHEVLKRASISDRERGNAWPSWEWTQTFVIVCLRNRLPRISREQIAVVLEHWKTVWERIDDQRTGQTPAIPPQESASLETQQATDITGIESEQVTNAINQATDEIPVSAPTVEAPTAGVRSPRRARVWVLSGATAVLVVVAGAITATTTGIFDTADTAQTTPSTPTASSAPLTSGPAASAPSASVNPGPDTSGAPTAGPSVVNPPGLAPPKGANGVGNTVLPKVTPPPPAIPVQPLSVRMEKPENALNVKEGLDLDTGTRPDQEAAGVDISFSSGSSHLDAMAVRVSYTILPDAGPVVLSRCEQATGWTRNYGGMYDLVEGRNICVKTNENRYSMLTITNRATPTTGTISLKYTTWN